jgi:iron-sulfur cluster repair protein YtfE (RIC family)
VSTASPLSLHAAPAAGFDEPFAMLAACHDRVRRSLALLQRLEQHLVRLGGADDAAAGAAADVLRYFDRAAPAHHEDEERHVLPALRASGDGAMAELADRLHAEHEKMAAAWALVRPGLHALAAPGSAAWPAEPAAQQAEFEHWRRFAALYAGHLEAEDGLAFPRAAARLAPAAQQAMGREMAERRGVAAPPMPPPGGA